MISREVLNAQRELYVKGREQALASFGGALECIDNLLRLLDEADAAHPTENSNAATDAAEEHTNA